MYWVEKNASVIVKELLQCVICNVAVSPGSSYLNPPSPPTTESGMIVLSESCQFTSADQYVVASGSRMYTSEQDTEDGKQLLLLSSNTNNPTEVSVDYELARSCTQITLDNFFTDSDPPPHPTL